MANLPDRSRGVKCFIISCAAPRRRSLSLAAAAIAALAGCDNGPVSGQVVAVVDGEEITIPELNAEARARGLVIGTDRAVRDRVLQDLIDRKLLVQAALDRQLDRTPDHLLAKRRSDEMLLASELIEALGRRGPGLTDQDIAKFVASRPYAFDRRALLSVDRIRVLAPLAPALAQAVGAARSLDDAQSLLASKGIAAERRVEVWDSATLAPEMAGQLLAPARDATILLRLPDQTIVANVIEVVPQPTPAANRAQFARELMSGQRSQQLLLSVLQQEKSSAKIRYHPRFAPR
jgi:EpsD family peptidyl-prolyl cis-trans isomerase